MEVQLCKTLSTLGVRYVKAAAASLTGSEKECFLRGGKIQVFTSTKIDTRTLPEGCVVAWVRDERLCVGKVYGGALVGNITHPPLPGSTVNSERPTPSVGENVGSGLLAKLERLARESPRTTAWWKPERILSMLGCILPASSQGRTLL